MRTVTRYLAAAAAITAYLAAAAPALAEDADFYFRPEAKTFAKMIPPEPPAPPASVEQPVAQKVVFERRCSFDVVKLQPGLYRTKAPDIRAAVAALWAPGEVMNRWLYGHVAGNCTASGGSLGYKWKWSNTEADTAALFSASVMTTGVASTELSNGQILINVTMPIWLSGEIAAGIPIEQIG